MSQVKNIVGTGIPLRGDDIDTDRIIPARFLRCVTFDGLGEQVFADDRTQMNSQHPFDLPQYQGAKILVVNANFGCGSSREHAPQAIIRWGIQGIIGESFAEIFFGNCIANGVPCVTANAQDIKQIQTIIEENPQASIMLDLKNLEVHCEQFTAPISLNEGARQMLIAGSWDSCGQLLQNTAEIKTSAAKLPYLQWGGTLLKT
ncbi:3-isopropylmalate dehydratase small subunit [Aphanothece hegewaldii CCALA 016]|uniref:3-isopropylmalate dehydratase small subunit n=1 Tax=Aphanothece hegewaldii CCALA 016 TaxID=2107694 RepID=A0A2T1LZ02_9CHRO|nr:3-isopropylmalate dehydratase small subunit [Aphanothece hegewaldii]PSF37634.1 3-isopropylmalate dehydratase small subunit [Aphanothece hegewaldii CCALA 016]